MNVELSFGDWIIGSEYIIENSPDDKHAVYRLDYRNDTKPLFKGSFEECLTWCYNN